MSFGTGMRDWLIQRVTAAYLALYLVGLLIVCARVPSLDYHQWHGLFAQPIVRITTLMAFISVAMHAWIGIWTIATDYIKPYGLRLFFLSIVIFVLVGELVWGIDVLWGMSS